ncbi:hypothetical protein AM588_10008012 [Phytophthora nicotianae]|uniref:Uncharacterized protein n=1 Tax=Phytophthora nicotianae TaxID=4792 RepID=A0A0W8DEQ0_PHYNI|nr:hypothetical protein AM588_10008012 [Phytophthora nicotianae]
MPSFCPKRMWKMRREGGDDQRNPWKAASKVPGGDNMSTRVPKPPNGPARGADAKSGGTEFKPGEVRKLRKCYACKETILGRTKVCKDQIFHEICLLCKGCRESIEEDEDFTLIKKKAYHADCAKDVNHCFVCDKEILGRVYRAGDGAFHKLCMVCSVCNKQSKEAGAKLENDLLVCGECVAEKERKEREEREAALERERAAAKAKAEKEAALAAARALEEEKERKAREAQKAAEEAARAKAKAEAEAAAAARAQAEREAAEAEAMQRAAAAAVANGNGRSGTDSLRSSTSNLDEFDLEATPIDMSGHNGRISEVSDIDSLLSDGDYAGYMGNGQRESLRLSEVLDLESYDDDRLSDLSGISEGAGERNRQRRSTVERTVKENEETFSEDEDDRELCGGCGLVLEGEAVGALNQYFHYEAFHQGCYQARFGKKCHRCDKVLKGKVVKALDHLYHPDCFVCYQCSASLSESFFEHEGQAVCAKCKHEAIAQDEPSFPENMAPVSKGIAGYRFDAQDDTQLTIYPGDEVAILQKWRRITMEGYLWKRGRKVPSMKRHYAVLKGTMLSFYLTQDEAQRSGAVPKRVLEIIDLRIMPSTSSTDTSHPPHMVLKYLDADGGGTLQCRADSRETQQDWLETLQHALKEPDRMAQEEITEVQEELRRDAQCHSRAVQQATEAVEAAGRHHREQANAEAALQQNREIAVELNTQLETARILQREALQKLETLQGALEDARQRVHTSSLETEDSSLDQAMEAVERLAAKVEVAASAEATHGRNVELLQVQTEANSKEQQELVQRVQKCAEESKILRQVAAKSLEDAQRAKQRTKRLASWVATLKALDFTFGPTG